MTILGIWGDDKTCKTTLALTAPKPLAYMEFDLGGFDRAKHRFKEDVDNNNIMRVYKNETAEHPLIYVVPSQVGDVDVKALTVRPSKRIVGIKELWYKFLVHYIMLLNDPQIISIVIDTSTLLWEVCSLGYLQEKQEIQLDPQGNLRSGEKKLRESLLPIEYKEPNIRMRGLVYQAKVHSKHLILTHHSRDEYGPMLIKGEVVEAKTGKKERSGWSPLGDGADIIVHTSIKDKIPYCNVELAEVLELVGMEFKEPSFDKIMEAVKMIRGEQ